MKLSWMFGSSMEAHHLLASYLLVWLIQGGYAAWIALQWRRSGRNCSRTSRFRPSTTKTPKFKKKYNEARNVRPASLSEGRTIDA